MLTRRSLPISVAYVGVGALFGLAYFRAPGLSTNERLPFYLAVSLSAAVAIVVGVLRYRPASRLPWALIAASQLVYFAADVTFYTYHDILRNTKYPAPADALYLAHYPILAAGLVLLGSRRRGSLLDTLILGTAFALLEWILLMAPYVHPSAGSLLPRLTSLAYPVADLLVLVSALRLLGAPLRVPAMAYLAGAFLFLFFSDFAYAWLQVKGTYSGPGDFLDATWMTYYLLLGAAALSPSMRRLADAKPAPPPVRLGITRIALLAAAAFTAPVTLIVEHSRSAMDQDYAVATASIVVFALVIARLAAVARAQRRDQAEKERLLGRVVEAAERERIRFAADIYDGPIQKLFALGLRLDLLIAQLGRGELDDAAGSAQRIRGEIADQMDALARLVSNLRPLAIGDRGLAHALRDDGGAIAANVAVHVESAVEADLAPEVETVLYGIAREAFLNVDAHAQARRVDVTLSQREDEVVLSIRDDGRGFDGSAYARDPGGFPGLSSMDDLARSLGGSLRIVSGRGAGTEVRATLPLRERQDYGSELSQVTSAG